MVDSSFIPNFIPSDAEDTVDIGPDPGTSQKSSAELIEESEGQQTIPKGWTDPEDLVFEGPNLTTRLFVRWNGTAFMLYFDFKTELTGDLSSDFQVAEISRNPEDVDITYRIFEMMKEHLTNPDLGGLSLSEKVQWVKAELIKRDEIEANKILNRLRRLIFRLVGRPLE